MVCSPTGSNCSPKYGDAGDRPQSVCGPRSLPRANSTARAISSINPSLIMSYRERLRRRSKLRTQPIKDGKITEKPTETTEVALRPHHHKAMHPHMQTHMRHLEKKTKIK